MQKSLILCCATFSIEKFKNKFSTLKLKLKSKLSHNWDQTLWFRMGAEYNVISAVSVHHTKRNISVSFHLIDTRSLSHSFARFRCSAVSSRYRWIFCCCLLNYSTLSIDFRFIFNAIPFILNISKWIYLLSIFISVSHLWRLLHLFKIVFRKKVFENSKHCSIATELYTLLFFSFFFSCFFFFVFDEHRWKSSMPL